MNAPMHENREYNGDGSFAEDLERERERERRAEDTFWQAIGRLFHWRRFIIGATGGVAVLAVVFSLLMPNIYMASTRLLLPSQGSGGALSSALLGNLPSAARSFLGGQVGDYTRYIALLTSRTIYEEVVEQFDLVRIYETAEAQAPVDEAVKLLRDNTAFVVDDEYEFLSVEVYDEDPQRAADMANFFVDRLNELNMELSSLTAANFRRYVEGRYAEAETALDSLLDAMQEFQQQYGVFDLTAQTEAFFGQMADLRSSLLETEIRYETLHDQLGPDHPQVRALADAVRAGRRKYQEALGGQEQILPVPQGSVPSLVREFADLERERLIQTRILEVVAPMREEARFEEQRKVEAVQVVDPAVPPSRKARPKRSLIVMGATFSAFLLAIAFVFLYEWWRRRHRYFAHRLQEAARQATPAEQAPPEQAPAVRERTSARS